MSKDLSIKIITIGIRHLNKKFGSKINWRCISLLHDFNQLKGSGVKITHIMERIIREGEVFQIIPRTGDVD